MAGTNSGNFTIIDGFTVSGSGGQTEYGIDITGATNGTNTPGSHHVWVLNTIVHGTGGGGIFTANSDYTYFIHDTVFGAAASSNCTTAAQNSGMGDNVPIDSSAFSSYNSTADDKTNPNPLIGSFVVGSSWFHKVYAWNVLYNNHEGACSSNGNTDGNNFILDTFLASNDSGVPGGPVASYTDQTLVAFNVSYNSGGVGIHLFRTAYVTLANNSVYNGGLDPNLNAAHPTMDENGGFANTFLNNLVVAIPLAPVSPPTVLIYRNACAGFQQCDLGRQYFRQESG